MEETPAFATDEWRARPGSWEETVNPYQMPMASDILDNEVMMDSDSGTTQGESY